MHKIIIKSIGSTAGKLYEIIDNSRGQMSYNDLVKKNVFNEQDLLLAIGWLSREDKIFHFVDENNQWMLQLIY